MTHHSRSSRFLSALLAAGALIPLLASCGGGGGGNQRPNPATIDSATPAPLSRSPATASCDNNSFTPNYASSVSLLHWNKFPLRVHFVQNDQLSDARRTIALAGFNRWVSATGGRADYTLVGKDSSPNVTVSFYRFTGGSGDTLGTSTVTYDSNNVIRKAVIELGITGDTADDTLTAAHEYGHTLGITGHSPRELDLMFFTGNRSGEVTESDLNTAITAYCNNFNRASNLQSAAVGPLKTIVMH